MSTDMPKQPIALDQAAVGEIRELLYAAAGLVGVANGVNPSAYQVGDPVPPAVAEFALRAGAMIDTLDAAAISSADRQRAILASGWSPLEDLERLAVVFRAKHRAAYDAPIERSIYADVVERLERLIRRTEYANAMPPSQESPA